MPPHDLSEPAAFQRLRLLFGQARSASLIAITGALFCAAMIASATGQATVLPWLAAVLAASGLRLHLYRRFFRTTTHHRPERYWLRQHAWTAALVGLTWGMLPLVPTTQAGAHIHELQTLVPAFVLVAAITSYGVYPSQYLVLLGSMTVTAVTARLYVSGTDGMPEALLFGFFTLLLGVTAKRYGGSLVDTLHARQRSEQLLHEVTRTNAMLQQQNSQMAQQQDLLQQEEALARHVFRQLTLGGDHQIPGIHTWTQPMGSLSGDLTQTVRGPKGEAYVLLGDFTGHGLPAALGALPASSVFLAMAAKGLPIETITSELNNKLHQLLPVGYFCCAVLLELSADRRELHVWNGGLPPLLIRRHGRAKPDYLRSHSLPLGVVDAHSFDPTAQRRALAPGDLVYAYTDGLTEAENVDGEMWGSERLESFLLREDLPAPRLPALINAVLEYVNLAPASDDISVLEVEASPAVAEEAHAA
jgi:serine phosphatase RsbU (regulator of sigma subunit)